MTRKLGLIFGIVLPFFGVGQDIPNPFFRIDIQEEDLKPIEVAELSVEVEVIGNLATTTYDVLFYNPNFRVLEGDLDIPLADGQSIGRFALDINGKLREGVAVEKTKGRVAYETIVRRNVDPALLEHTVGNNFRTRVYPIPSRGHRRVVFAVEESLPWEEQALRYQLPLYLGQSIDKFKIKVDVVNQPLEPQWEENGFSNFGFEQWNTHFIAEHEATDFEANQTLRFRVPKPASWREVYVTPTGDGDYFFMLQTVPEVSSKRKTLPSRLTILWDASASGKDRNIDREVAMMEAYFAENKEVQIEFVAFRDDRDVARTIIIENGDIAPLLKELETVVYDGGTRGAFFNQHRWVGEEIWVFSDGLFTLGDPAELLKKPVYTITSNASADFDGLRRMAAKGGGNLINLNRQTNQEAVATLTTATFQFMEADFGRNAFKDVYPATPQPLAIGEVFTLTGRIQAPEADVTLKFGVGGRQTGEELLTVRTMDANETIDLERRWAYQKYAYLGMDQERNQGSMVELAKAFTLVTPLTSLIVLETVDDYLEHQIFPPEEFQEEYLARITEQEKQTERTRQDHINQALAEYQERIDWWNTDFPGWPKNALGQAEDTGASGGFGSADDWGEEEVEIEYDEAYAAPTGSVERSAPASDEASYEMDSFGMADDDSWGEEPSARTDRAQMAATEAMRMEESSTEPVAMAASVEIQAWDPERSYLETLKAEASKDRYMKYLELREEHEDAPGFYLDVAIYFHEEGEEALGLRILSNLAEMKLNSDELLRVLGHQYRQWEKLELAEVMMRKVLDLREELPQSYRDLALVLTAQGEYEEAAELYMHVVAEIDDDYLSRFPRIRELCLYELNQLRELDGNIRTPDIPQDKQTNLPVDVRVVMTWNVSDVDIDLWLKDPYRERTGYSNTLSRIGSRYTSDYTGGGLGPEEIMLKEAKKGTYEVVAHYYGSSAQRLVGPVTVQVAIYTHYGTENQEMQELTLQLEDQEDDYLVGTFEFGG